MGFYQVCWDIIKGDLVEVFKEFYDSGSLHIRAKATFIALIPKVVGASSLLDYGPISLIGSLYKIIAKVLSLKLQGVMGHMVSSTQSAFIKGR